jgi:ribosome recycling factor
VEVAVQMVTDEMIKEIDDLIERKVEELTTP